MKLKITLVLLFSFGISIINAQEVKLKKGIVYVNGQKQFEYHRGMGGSPEISIFTLGREKEILFIQNNCKEDLGFDFEQLVFIQEKRKIESVSLSSMTFRMIIAKLLRNNILRLDGSIDAERLDIFYLKYHDYITERKWRPAFRPEEEIESSD